MTYQDYLLAAKLINHDEKVNKLILLSFIEKDLPWLYANLHQTINSFFLKSYLALITKYVEGYPFQYLVHYQWFYGHKFFVDPRVLIPRNETEELVSNVLSYSQKIFQEQSLKVLDLGTGSGAIAISLAIAKPTWKIFASDISSDALAVAKINCNNHHLNNVALIKSNLFENLQNQQFNIIIANPPYIDQDSNTFKNNLKHEPALALFAKNKGLFFYFLILQQCLQFVTKPFLLAFEFGFDQKTALEIIVNQNFNNNYHYQFQKDVKNNWRMLFIWPAL